MGMCGGGNSRTDYMKLCPGWGEQIYYALREDHGDLSNQHKDWNGFQLVSKAEAALPRKQSSHCVHKTQNLPFPGLIYPEGLSWQGLSSLSATD